MRHHRITGSLRETAVGVDGVRAETFERSLERSLAEIARRVARVEDDGLPSYRFAPLLAYEKVKPSGGVRSIYIPRLRDQVVFRAMHEDLLGAAKSEGLDLRPTSPRLVVRQLRAELTPSTVILRTDLQSFFDSVPRDRVIERSRSLPIEAVTFGLLKRWGAQVTARKPWRAGKDSDRLVEGLPAGLSISASLAELWVSELDARARGKFKYFRYVDDIAFVCASMREAESALAWLSEEVRGLGLTLSDSKTKIVPIEAGVSWLGLTHWHDRARADVGRPEAWLRRFARFRRDAVVALRQPEADVPEVLAAYQRAVRDEVEGRTSLRPSWYAEVEDDGEWRTLDRSLHAMIRSLYRTARAAAPTGRALPSIHRAIAARRRRDPFSAPSIADQGQCAAISPASETSTPNKGIEHPTAAEKPTHSA